MNQTKDEQLLNVAENILALNTAMRFASIRDLKGNIIEGIMKDRKLHWSLKNNKKNFVRMLLRHEKCVKHMIRNLVRFVMYTQKEKMSLKSLCILKNIPFLLQRSQNYLLIKNYKL